MPLEALGFALPSSRGPLSIPRCLCLRLHVLLAKTKHRRVFPAGWRGCFYKQQRLPGTGPRWGPGFKPPSSARASLGAWIRAPFLCQGLPRTSLIAPRLNREEHRGYKTGPLPGAQGKAGPGRHQEDRQAAPVSPSPSGLAGLAPARHYLPDLFLFFRRTSLGCFSQHVAEDATPSTSNVTRMFLKCLSWSSPHPFQSHRKISEQLRLSERIKRVQTEDMVMP